MYSIYFSYKLLFNIVNTIQHLGRIIYGCRDTDLYIYSLVMVQMYFEIGWLTVSIFLVIAIISFQITSNNQDIAIKLFRIYIIHHYLRSWACQCQYIYQLYYRSCFVIFHFFFICSLSFFLLSACIDIENSVKS